MKTRRKGKRRFSAPALSEEQLPDPAPIAKKFILYLGKLVPNRHAPLAVARCLAEEFRASPQSGIRLLGWVIEKRWNEKDFVHRMLKSLSKCLEDGQPVFHKMDYAIVDILMQHPRYTNKEITAALCQQYPRQKGETPEKHWDRLEQHVKRLLSSRIRSRSR
jgi:hypothetical protein